MATNMIDAYSLYQTQSYETQANKKDAVKAGKKDKTDSTDTAQNTEKTEKTQQTQVNLSDKAKALLEELKKTYSNMDFFVADYSTEEEAQEYLSRGTKEYSVLIDPETLEQMAADEDTKNMYLGIIDSAVTQIDDVKEQLGDDADNVSRIGITIGNDGSVSFFAELEKSSEKQRERIEEAREEKRAEEKEKEKKAEEEEDEERLEEKQDSKMPRYNSGVKRTSVQANSIEELLEKIQSVDWDSIKSETPAEVGGKYDFSV